MSFRVGLDVSGFCWEFGRMYFFGFVCGLFGIGLEVGVVGNGVMVGLNVELEF